MKQSNSHLSTDLFEMMIEEISVDEINSLTPDQLPATFSSGFLERLSSEKREALGALMSVINEKEAERQRAIDESMDATRRPIIAYAKLGIEDILELSTVQNVGYMTDLYTQYVQTKTASVLKNAESFKISHVIDLKVLNDTMLMHQEYIKTLEEPIETTSIAQNEYDQALATLRSRQEKLAEQLISYYSVKLDVAKIKITNLSASLDKNVKLDQEVHNEIDLLLRRISSTAKAKRLSPGQMGKDDFIASMQKELEFLQVRRDRELIIIADNSVFDYLEIVIETLSSPTSIIEPLQAKFNALYPEIVQSVARYCYIQDAHLHEEEEGGISYAARAKDSGYALDSETAIIKFLTDHQTSVASSAYQVRAQRAINVITQKISAAIVAERETRNQEQENEDGDAAE